MKTMDIKSHCDRLQDNLKQQLETINLENPEPVSKISKCMIALNTTISNLKSFVHDYTFHNTEEEIHFFKEIKPIFLSQYYYYEKLFSVRINEPFEGGPSLRHYYNDQLNDLQSFIKLHAEFYRYCLSNSKDLDDRYFKRTESPLKDPDIDSKFSTGYDNTLARILACQLVKEYLIGLIQNISTDFDPCKSQLKWTGSKAALIELIYALQCVDTVNGGKVDIKQIADPFESLFNISLGNYYRHFQEIRLRKSGKATFLDLMKEKFIQRLDELDEK
jgi:hypothetical protein